MTKKEQRERKLRKRLARYGDTDRQLAKAMQALGKEHGINTYSTESAALQAIRRFRGGGSLLKWGLDLLDLALPQETSPAKKTTKIEVGERQAVATLMRQIICIAEGRSIREAHKINWERGQAEVFGSRVPLGTWEELDEWHQEHVAPLLRKVAV